MEQVEAEIRAIQGVKRVYYELTHWYRDEMGRWASIGSSSSSSTAPDTSGEMKVLVMERASKDESPDGESTGDGSSIGDVSKRRSGKSGEKVDERPSLP